jgi:hypothetical protein
MSLWGKVAKGMSLIIAAVFAVVAIVAPETRPESVLAAVLMVAVALLGVPALVRLFSFFTGDEEVLEKGTVGIATITSLAPTRWRYNRYYPVVRFGLNVEAAGVYPVEIKQAVDPDLLPRLAPGVVVGVRVDPLNRTKVVIDWAQPIRTAAGAPVDQSVTGATHPTVAPATKRSAWPFLPWGFLLFGLIFLRLGCEEGYYETGGVRAQGVVIQKTYSPGTTGTGGSRSSPARYYVSYRFTTKEGRTLEGRADVLLGTWGKLKEGDQVVVEYLPSSPDTNRIPDQRARSQIWWIMALVLLSASAVLFIRGRRRRPAGKVP